MARQLNLFSKPPSTYAVSVHGYDDVEYTALSAGKARARAYRDFCEEFGHRDFHWFLINSRVRRATPSEEGTAA